MCHRANSEGKAEGNYRRPHRTTEASSPHVGQVGVREAKQMTVFTHLSQSNTEHRSLELRLPEGGKKSSTASFENSKNKGIRTHTHLPVCTWTCTCRVYVQRHVHTHLHGGVRVCTYMCVSQKTAFPHIRATRSLSQAKTKPKQRGHSYLRCPTSRCIHLCRMNY